MVVNITTDDNGLYIADKSLYEIIKAFADGVYVVCHVVSDESVYKIYHPVNACFATDYEDAVANFSNLYDTDNGYASLDTLRIYENEIFFVKMNVAGEMPK